MEWYDTARELFVDGKWFEAIQTWLTAGNDPVLAIVVPSVIFGTMLVAYFIVGQSPLIPVVLSIIFSGVMFTSMPGSALQIIVITLITTLTVAGMVMTWRFGR